MEILAAVGLGGDVVILDHPPKDEKNAGTIESMWEIDRREYCNATEIPGIYRANVEWEYCGNPENPEDVGDGWCTYLDNFELITPVSDLKVS